MMQLNKYNVRRMMWTTLLTGSIAMAGGPQYLGFTINVDTEDKVKQRLKARGTNYKDNYGYKGYSDLPMIKVMSDPIFGEQGQLREAWLHFSPDKKLYKLSVEWYDAGETFKTIHDVMDAKYKNKGKVLNGFITNYYYQDNDVKITLTRNTFGFGANQKTSLEYLHEPSVKAVETMRGKIEQHIKASNLKNKGKDL